MSAIASVEMNSATNEVKLAFAPLKKSSKTHGASTVPCRARGVPLQTERGDGTAVELKGAKTIPAPREAVWRLLNDVAILKASLKG